MADSYPSLGVVIVNFNAGAVLTDCVRSVLASPVPATIEVVDNASSDDSLALLEAAVDAGAPVRLTRNAENTGFARAVNQAARAADTEYLLVLNPDCVLDPGALEHLLAALEADPSAALAGPLVRDAAGAVEAACLRRFPRPWQSFVTATGLWRLAPWLKAFRGVRVPGAAELRQTVEAEATSGACMMLRRAALTEVGFLDAGYALHFEDLDLMFRLRQAGWRCLFVPGAGARHLKGVSSRSRPLWVHWQKHRGMMRFYRNCLSAEHGFAVGLLVMLGTWAHFLLLLPVAWLRR